MRGKTDAILLGDIGGTNARFALLTQDGIGAVEKLSVAAHQRPEDAIAAFTGRHGADLRLKAAVLAVAGPVESERCVFVNNPWVVDGPALCQSLGLERVTLVNDFAALAWSLHRLTPDDLGTLGGAAEPAAGPAVVLGPGTGLGVAGVVPGAEGWTVIASEAGHASLPGGNDRDDAVIGRLRARFGHVSAERVLSGPGLEQLYRALAECDGIDAPPRSAPDITAAALRGDCPVSTATVEMFCALLGEVAGNLALTFGATGGAYIAGGIAPQIVDLLRRSAFRARFEAKGRLSAYLRPIPTWVILRDDAAFIGMRALIEQQSGEW